MSSITVTLGVGTLGPASVYRLRPGWILALRCDFERISLAFVGATRRQQDDIDVLHGIDGSFAMSSLL